MYRVIKHFTDLQDKSYAYYEGDEFPRKGLKVSDERLEELSSDKNKRGIPLIEFIEEPLPFTEADDEPEEVEEVAEAPDQEKPKPKRGRKKG